MKFPNAQDLLESVVDITSQQDSDAFRSSLVATIHELIPLHEVIFARARSSPSGELQFQTVIHDIDHRQGLPVTGAEQLETLLSPANVMRMMTAGYLMLVEVQEATLLLPILNRDRLAEILILRGERIPESALTMLTAFARLYRNFNAVLTAGQHDPMTGLLNRRTFELRINQLASQADNRVGPVRTGSGRPPISGPARHYVAVIDIDNFKRINDTLGHLFGDDVILMVARKLREAFRDEDQLFRFGGEEFVVMLTLPEAVNPQVVLERLCLSIAQHPFPQLDLVTVSVGFIEVRGGEASSTIIGRADQALYHAKATGKNRVCDYDALVKSGAIAAPIENTEAHLF